MFKYKGIQITPKKLFYKLRSLFLFIFVLKDFLLFKKLRIDSRFPLSFTDSQPQLGDDTATVEPERHYTYHPAWAARVLAETKPKEHVDISSTLSFAELVSAFIPVKFYDYRPAKINLDNLYCGKADLKDLSFPGDSISSLSSMHVVEHVGLGRYGDAIDPQGDIKAMKELQRVVAPGGYCYL